MRDAAIAVADPHAARIRADAPSAIDARDRRRNTLDAPVALARRLCPDDAGTAVRTRQERLDGLRGDVADLWRRFKAGIDPDRASHPEHAAQARAAQAALRDRLIIHYMTGHVRRIAQRLHSQLPPQVDLEDLVNEAYDPLVRLIENYDLNKNSTFETYSSSRLQGAMLDYLRAIDPAPRLVRQRAKRLQNASEQFRKLHGRAPSSDELRCHMALSERMFAKFQRDARPAMMIAFNSAGAADSEHADEVDGMDSFEDDRALTPLSRAEHEDIRTWITQGFTRRDRLILVLYYYEQMTMKDIGGTLGCSESRVSQRLDCILRVLRSRLDHARARRLLAEQ